MPDREIDKYSHYSSSVAYRDDSIIPSDSPEGRFPNMAPRTLSPTFEPFTDVDDLQPTDKGKGQIHVSLVMSGEQKTKPTQQVIRDVRSTGLAPDLVEASLDMRGGR